MDRARQGRRGLPPNTRERRRQRPGQTAVGGRSLVTLCTHISQASAQRPSARRCTFICGSGFSPLSLDHLHLSLIPRSPTPRCLALFVHVSRLISLSFLLTLSAFYSDTMVRILMLPDLASSPTLRGLPGILWNVPLTTITISRPTR